MKVLQSAMLRRDPVGRLAWAVLVAWLALTGAAFWHFELGDWRTFADAQAPPRIDAALLEAWFQAAEGPQGAPAADSKVTLIHLYNPNCRCNRFTEPHLSRLRQAFESRGVRFLAAAPSAGSGPAPLGLEAVHADVAMLHAAGVRSAPAALIFDATGRLLYYGPYSSAAWCGSAGALVDPVLLRALSGAARLGGASPVRGCFCEW